MLFSNVEDDVIYDIHEYATAVPLKDFSEAIGCTLLCGSLDQVLFGYTVVNSLNAIMQFSSDEFNRIYGWSTERALSSPTFQPENHRWLRSVSLHSSHDAWCCRG